MERDRRVRMIEEGGIEGRRWIEERRRIEGRERTEAAREDRRGRGVNRDCKLPITGANDYDDDSERHRIVRWDRDGDRVGRIGDRWGGEKCRGEGRRESG